MEPYQQQFWKTMLERNKTNFKNTVGYKREISFST